MLRKVGRPPASRAHFLKVFTAFGWSCSEKPAGFSAVRLGGHAPNFAALVADIIFCLLDAYYLKMEMQYRDLYDEVRRNPINTDFNMDASRFSKSLCEALKSKSVWILYLAVFILLLAGLVLILAIK